MKKLMAVLMAVMMLVCCGAALAENRIASREDAMQAALDYAGLKADQVTFTKVRQDWEDGRQVYEVEFVSGRVEYELEIDVRTGRIIEADRDRYDGFGRDRDDDWDDDWDDWFDFD